MKSNTLILAGSLLFGVISCTDDAVTEALQVEEVVTISSTIPSDININEKDKLMAEGKMGAVRDMFDIFSWESFIAINWPVDAKGKPKAKLTDDGLPAWYLWKEGYEVFRELGQKPEPWGSKRTVPEWILDEQLAETGKTIRILYKSNKVINVADEEFQAFAGPIFDQSGNLVRYEVLMNEEEFDYIVKEKLYNLNGQIEFAKKNSQIADFPAGVYEETQKVGATEIKIAWKVLVHGTDDFSRYIKVPSWVHSLDGKSWKKVTVGMVGFHINHKTTSASQWVWSTFEHVDNLATNEATTFKYKGKDVPLKATFFDPECEICPTNQFNRVDTTGYIPANGQNPTFYQPYYIPAKKKIMGTNYYIAQAHRMIPIPERLQELNRKIQAQMKAAGSPLQYYELIGTQFPKDQQVPPAAPTYAAFPNSVINKPGGNPDPIYLTNMTMETYFQNGNQGAYNFMENGSQPLDADEQLIYGTESCMGCHSSAQLAVDYPAPGSSNPKGGGQLSADFVWLLSQQAKWIGGKPPVNPQK